MLEAYSKSDMFKKKYEEMIADREQHNAEFEATGNAIKAAIEKSKN